MKRPLLLLFIICSLFLVSGCATSRIITEMGASIGDSFRKSAAKGEISADQSIKAWPYISGIIKGSLGHNYEFEVSAATRTIIGRLDTLAAKTRPLTQQEKGEVIGLFVRLEIAALREGWDRYGVNIMSMIRSLMAGG